MTGEDLCYDSCIFFVQGYYVFTEFWVFSQNCFYWYIAVITEFWVSEEFGLCFIFVVVFYDEFD